MDSSSIGQHSAIKYKTFNSIDKIRKNKKRAGLNAEVASDLKISEMNEKKQSKIEKSNSEETQTDFAQLCYSSSSINKKSLTCEEGVEHLKISF